YYYVYVTNGLRDTQNVQFAGTTYYLHTDPSTDLANPTLISIAPADGTIGVGVNGLVRATFSEAINPLTVNSTRLALSAGNPIPTAFGWDSTNTVVTITPLAPLPDNAVVTIAMNGVQDPAGN